ncbi:hypothetical protein PIB30_039923 [Stylosanthes scabra]|uniref:Uncharacterized protein n=1 Tax=Stylosanthes scabra TaxID=79078 RepID=A0ABU6RF43_9FABA|nr:hypothetical protein [Stylosanthes scabra]
MDSQVRKVDFAVLLREEIGTLKNQVNGLAKDKKDLESRVMELCAEKEEIELDRKNHGLEMFALGFKRAKAHAELFAPGVKFDKMDPTKVVFDGKLVDDDEVAVEGGGDHTPVA